jgi:contact-dependent growth inhibition (CDI) system CdiI-like immunity protein
MTVVKASDFPELRRVFAGYLHEDFVHEHGTPAHALLAFRRDADAAERERFSAEARLFLERTRLLDFDEVKALLSSLGARWMPPSRQALVTLLDAAAQQ